MKAAVIYTSLTGNTKIMAECIYQAYKSKNGEESVNLFSADSISPEEALEYETLILGSPAMGPSLSMKLRSHRILKNVLNLPEKFKFPRRLPCK